MQRLSDLHLNFHESVDCSKPELYLTHFEVNPHNRRILFFEFKQMVYSRFYGVKHLPVSLCFQGMPSLCPGMY